jgi:branched-chain amino acid transport system permease protein
VSRLNVIGLIIFALVLLTIPLYFSSYMTQIAITTITYSMLGLAFAFGMRVGLPRLDLAAWWGVGGYTTALLMKAGISFWVTALAGGTIAVILGSLLFSLALPRGMVAFFVFCMVLSMAVYQMFGTVSIFGGWGGITDVPKPTIFSFVIDSQLKTYYLGLFFLAITATVYYLLYHSRIGRAWDSIASSLRLARSIGVDVVRYRLVNVLIGNFFIAVAGSFFVSYFSAAIPDIFTFNAGINTIIFLFIGGFGHSLIGPILGAVIATFIPEYFRFTQQLQSIITSVIVILILMFLPMGVLGVIDKRLMPLLHKTKWYVNLNRGSLKGTGRSEPIGN